MNMDHSSPKTPSLSRRHALALLAGATAAPSLWAQTGTPWPAIESAARGQKVFFNAWGGSERTNAYLQWAAEEAGKRFSIDVQHVKLTDTAEAVKRVRAEKAAGKSSGGSVDMVWINGENFLAMKQEGLLFGPFAESLPSYRFVDTVGKPSTRIDSSEPVDGMEAPWGMAQFTLYADRSRVPDPPRSMAALATFARANPGRVTYPRPPAFLGTTFLKQALLELHAPATGKDAPPDGGGTITQRAALYKPVTPQVLEATTAPLWTYLDALHPHLWRAGRQFPQTPAAIRQMMADGDLLIALTFNPNEAANEIVARRQSGSVYSWQMAGGAIGNTHFLAIPFNANAPQAAQVFINFLLSPEAQARKADIAVWGDPTVLALDRLRPQERALFGSRPARGQVEQGAPLLLEPHGSWTEVLEREWIRRYAR